MIFFCGFTCASLPFNLNPISLHIAQIPDGCQRHRRKSTDGFFWKNHEMTVLESCPIPKWGTYMTSWPLCSLSLSFSLRSISLSHRFTWLMSFHDRHLSFIPWPPFCACLIRFVTTESWPFLLCPWEMHDACYCYYIYSMNLTHWFMLGVPPRRIK